MSRSYSTKAILSLSRGLTPLQLSTSHRSQFVFISSMRFTRPHKTPASCKEACRRPPPSSGQCLRNTHVKMPLMTSRKTHCRKLLIFVEMSPPISPPKPSYFRLHHISDTNSHQFLCRNDFVNRVIESAILRKVITLH